MPLKLRKKKEEKLMLKKVMLAKVLSKIIAKIRARIRAKLEAKMKEAEAAAGAGVREEVEKEIEEFAKKLITRPEEEREKLLEEFMKKIEKKLEEIKRKVEEKVYPPPEAIGMKVEKIEGKEEVKIPERVGAKIEQVSGLDARYLVPFGFAFPLYKGMSGEQIIKKVQELYHVPFDVGEEEKKKIRDVYPLIPESPKPGEPVFAWAYIHWDPRRHELVYEVIEPRLTAQEMAMLKELEEHLKEKLDVAFDEKSIGDKKAYLRQKIKEVVELFGWRLPKETRQKLEYYIFRDFIGLGKIEPLMHDPNIEDISCDGVGIPVYVFHRKPEYGQMKTNIIFNSKEELDAFVMKLAQRCGKSISVAQPLLDGTLPDGSRLQATLGSDIARRGSNFCIRDGWILLGDGELERISKIFERLKKERGSKKIDNKEIVNAKLKVITFDGKKIGIGKTKSIIRLKADVWYRISFREAGKFRSSIDVTPEHKFIVIGENGLEEVEAEKIKEGSWVVLPKKIEIEERDLYKEFLLRFLREANGIYIKIEDEETRRKILEIERNKDIKRRKVNSVSSRIFLEALGEEIFKRNSITILKREGRKGRGGELKIPTKLTKDLAYLLGFIAGDGNLNRLGVNIACESKERVKMLGKMIEKTFGVSPRLYKGNKNRLFINRRALAEFLSMAFEVELGKKAKKIGIPKFIMSAEKEIAASFIRGLFHADGRLKDQIFLSSASERLISQLRFLLLRFGIFSIVNRDKNGVYRLYIPAPYYEEASEIFEEASELVKKRRRNKRGKVIPALVFRKLLEETERRAGKKIWKEISYHHVLKQEVTSVEKFLKLLRIAKMYGVNTDKYEILPEFEFARVEEVRKIEREEYFYDLELEDGKYYVGGELLPLFLFDTIRKFTKEPLTPIHLLEYKTISSLAMAYLWMCVEYGKSILVAGATATGKTTMLNAISLFIRPELKVVSIEDTAELKLPHENWIPQVARPGFGEKAYGAVEMFDLLKAALRQRPDYVIVGEVRGKEASVMFQGMSTGHPAMGTIHADTVQKVVDRLTTPPISLSPALLENLDVIVFMVRSKIKGKFVRRVKEIVEVAGVDIANRKIIENVVFKWFPVEDEIKMVGKSQILEKIAEFKGISYEVVLKELERRALFLEWLRMKGIRDYRRFSQWIKAYYMNPASVMRLVSKDLEAIMRGEKPA